MKKLVTLLVPLPCLALFVCVLAAPLFAADRVAIGSGDWMTDSNWYQNTKPAAGDNIFITSTSRTTNAVSLSLTTELGFTTSRLNIGGTGSTGVLVVGGAGVSAFSLTLGERTYIGAGGTGAMMISTGASVYASQGYTGFVPLCVGGVTNTNVSLSSNGLLQIDGGAFYISSSAAQQVQFASQNTGSQTATFIMNSGTFSSALTASNIGFAAGGAANMYARAYGMLYGGTFTIAGELCLGTATATTGDYKAEFTVSSKMDTMHVGGSNATTSTMLRLASKATLTLDVDGIAGYTAADWENKKIVDVNGRFEVVDNATTELVINFENFSAWADADAGDTITITLVSYDSDARCVGGV